MEKRKVSLKGIRFNNKLYWNDKLVKHSGNQVQIMQSNENNSINVYSKEGRFICKASDIKLTKTNETIKPYKPWEWARREKTSNNEANQRGNDKDMLGFGKKLEDYKTTELIKELQSRKHVTIARMNEGQQYKFRGDNKHLKEWGPATVLVIRNA